MQEGPPQRMAYGGPHAPHARKPLPTALSVALVQSVVYFEICIYVVLDETVKKIRIKNKIK